MKNPWFEIPLSDYEGHMDSPEVAQATLLADLFEMRVTQARSDVGRDLGMCRRQRFRPH